MHHYDLPNLITFLLPKFKISGQEALGYTHKIVFVKLGTCPSEFINGSVFNP